jgi:hypothetical protein
MLIHDGALRLFPNDPAGLRTRAQRAFAHDEMKSACMQFTVESRNAERLIIPPLEPEISMVAKAFIDLQQNRHEADYDLSQAFDRVRALTLVEQSREAMLGWRKVRNRPNANVFLATLLLRNRWNR